MNERWLEEAVKASGLPPCSTYPRDIQGDIALALSLRMVPLARLTTQRVCEWLDSKNLSRGGLVPTDDPRRGYMMARAGKGIIFYEERDTQAQQRFTLAHEVAHFVVDHLQPRRRALLKWGPGIQPVLDGKQPPTVQQNLFAVLERVTFGTQHNLMDRNDSGDICEGSTMEVEQRADRMAFELLAPLQEVLPVLRHSSNPEVEEVLVSRFGLPRAEARAYVRGLRAREPKARPFFLVRKKPEET